MDCDLCHYISISGIVKHKIRKNILSSVLCGLYHLHAANVVHRDLKPKNILMKGDRVVIADMGMSRDIVRATKSKRRMSLLAYTTCPPYCPPEGIFKCSTYGAEVDIWAFGCIWLEMILGRAYFKKSSPLDHPLGKMLSICNATHIESETIFQKMTGSSQVQNRTKKIHQNSSQPNLRSLLKDTDVSEEEIILLQKIFRLDPSSRITAEELVTDEFFESSLPRVLACPAIKKYKPPA
eukprot:CAMPEP_0206211108 /NCGR_PEP_ID=MMETSP0166-20121206/17943_1 /ASSEMBLY_ACC=CAM_ASM_000260 /TAXON_ID=95228 /ORGANISM="Vannella robusta, Strain DIVA3 518/3/11/1/6" /LENGTH=236 /DNA_ID=CAMNT_0053632903 /DNA_START=374 /DNA_END=1080 /DNA_ORIENTATION=-